MTSPQNHAATVAHFTDQNFFNLPADEVFFFEQGTLPAFTFEGKIILEDAGVVGMDSY